MTVPDRLLQRCTGLLLGFAMLFLSSAAQAQKVLDPYQIKRTVLSSDGRYMAFDFHKLGADEKTRTRYSVAVYDMATESIELHIAPPPREFHSASFSPDDRFLAVIQHCWAQECRPEELGLNVGVIDRENRRFQLVTADGEVVHDRRFTERRGGARKVRGFPTFDPTSDRIYFGFRKEAAVSRPGDKWRLPQILNFYGTSATHIGYVEIENGKRVEKTLGLDIGGGVSLAYLTATEKGIYAHVGTPSIEPYRSRGIWGGVINTESGEFSPLFPSPPYFSGPSLSQSNYRTDSLRASMDGRIAVFSHGIYTEADRPQDRIAVGRGGMVVVRDGVVAEQILPPRGRGPREVAISGDGRKAIMTVFNDSRIFWWVDLETRRVTEKPLRVPLEAAIARTRR